MCLQLLEKLKSTNRFEEEFRIVCPSGTVKWLRAIRFVAKDSVDQGLTFVGAAQEITLHKEMEGVLVNCEIAVTPDKEKSTRLLSECKQLANRCIREIRTLSYLLHPADLEQVGLIEAIRGYIKGFSQRSGIKVALELSPHLERMGRVIELTLFRVMQENLINIQRHSGSSRATIRIQRSTNLTLEISDYGSRASARLNRGEGIHFKPGVGISSMQERVKSIPGRFDVDSTADGPTVRVKIPVVHVAV